MSVSLIDMGLLRTIAGAGADESNMRSVLAGLARSGVTVELDRPHRFAHYLAQLLHESGRFRYDREIWGPTPAQRRYEGRRDLGNTEPGDGSRFRGRGPIQLTGRDNYRRFGIWARKIDRGAPDFEVEPDEVNTDPWEGVAPIWYWDAGNPTGRSLNIYADDNNAEAVTRKINGGLNGYEDRLALYTRAALVLLGYRLEAGAVRQFQEDAGFKGSDVDDIPGQRTRAALHGHLKAAERLAFGEAAAPPAPDAAPDPDATISEVRALLAEADRRLEAFRLAG